MCSVIYCILKGTALVLAEFGVFDEKHGNASRMQAYSCYNSLLACQDSFYIKQQLLLQGVPNDKYLKDASA